MKLLGSLHKLREYMLKLTFLIKFLKNLFALYRSTPKTIFVKIHAMDFASYNRVHKEKSIENIHFI